MKRTFGFRSAVPVVLLSSLSFSLMGVCVKSARATLHFGEVAFFRGVVGGLVALAAQRLLFGPLTRPRQPKALFIRCLFGTVAMIMFFFAIGVIPLADAVLLNKISPLFVMLLGVPVLKEHVSRWHFAVLLLALAGMALILRPSGAVFNLGGALCVASALLSAGAYLMVKKLTTTESPTVIVVWFMFFSAAVALLFLPWFRVPHGREWLFLAGTGVFAAGGQFFMTLAYQMESAAKTALLGYSGVVLASFWGWAFWGELWSPVDWAGAVLIVAACAMVPRLRAPIKY